MMRAPTQCLTRATLPLILTGKMMKSSIALPPAMGGQSLEKPALPPIAFRPQNEVNRPITAVTGANYKKPRSAMKLKSIDSIAGGNSEYGIV